VVFTLTFEKRSPLPVSIQRWFSTMAASRPHGWQRQQCADVPVHRRAQPEHRRPCHYGGGPQGATLRDAFGNDAIFPARLSIRRVLADRYDRAAAGRRYGIAFERN
jgi:hypothetical protein